MISARESGRLVDVMTISLSNRTSIRATARAIGLLGAVALVVACSSESVAPSDPGGPGPGEADVWDASTDGAVADDVATFDGGFVDDTDPVEDAASDVDAPDAAEPPLINLRRRVRAVGGTRFLSKASSLSM